MSDYGEEGDKSETKPKQKRDPAADRALLIKFNKWDKALDAHWGEWREEARKCFAMVAGAQIDDKTRQAAEDAGIAYVVLNKIDATISAICGSEIQGRQEVRYFPREMSQRVPVMGDDGQPQTDAQGKPVTQLADAKVNEILTGAAEWVRDECDASEEESQAFRNCIICGLGWTETRMDYEVDLAGMALIESVDPLEMGIDPSARRPNAIDAGYLRRKRRFNKEEAEQRFGIDADALPANEADSPGGTHENYPDSAYAPDKTTTEAPLGKDEIEITEYQWYELVKTYAVVNPQTKELEELDDATFRKMEAAGAQLDYQTRKKRRYRRAFRIATELLEVGDLPDEEFTYKAVTGKLDRNRGVWYGVVRAMIDPQMLINKMVSQVQRIIDTNAKGGLFAEMDAFEDPRQAEEEYARSDSIVWMKNGAIKDGRVMPKPVAPYPSAIDKLFAVMDEAVPGVSGVNKEMLGVVERDQAGILDTQRKQAAYSVLAGFFDSLRRYRRMQGRHLLKLITKYMSDERLIRIVGRQGNVQYVPLVRDPNVSKYDVIVDEAPAGPNMKERTLQFLQSPFGAEVLKQAPPQIQLKFLEFTPLPTSLIAEIQQIAENMPEQPDPDMMKAQAEMQLRQQQMQADAEAAKAMLETKQAEAVANMQLKAQEGAQSIKQKREEAALNIQLMHDKAVAEKQIAMDKIAGEREIAMVRIANEREIALLQMETEAELEEKRIASQERIGKHKATAAANGKSDFHKNRPGGSLSE